MATETPMWLMASLGCWWLWLSFLGKAYNQRNWKLSYWASFNSDLYALSVTNRLNKKTA